MRKFGVCMLAALLVAAMITVGCDDMVQVPAQSTTGVQKATVNVPTSGDGLTVEQHNVRQRLLEDNKVGAIKHLYIISPYSGQVIFYSTVKGKVTSSGKRLSPSKALSAYDQQGGWRGSGFTVPLGNSQGSVLTDEILGDDGTYGASGDYLYWWDVRGSYHQHYLTGGQIVHISDQPIPVKSITINMEAANEK